MEKLSPPVVNPKFEHNMMTVFLKLYGTLQSKFLMISVFSTIVGFMLPILNFIMLMGALVVMDTLTGLIAAIRLNQKIESRKAYRTIEKILVYCFAILSAHGINLVIIAPMGIEWLEDFTLVDIAVGSICFTEFLSLRENIEKITKVDILGGFKKAAQAFMDVAPRKKKDIDNTTNNDNGGMV